MCLLGNAPVLSQSGGAVRSASGAPVSSRRFDRAGPPVRQQQAAAPIEERTLADMVRAAVLRNITQPQVAPAAASQENDVIAQSVPPGYFRQPEGVALDDAPVTNALPNLFEQPVPVPLSAAPGRMPDESWRRTRSQPPERLFPWMR